MRGNDQSFDQAHPRRGGRPLSRSASHEPASRRAPRRRRAASSIGPRVIAAGLFAAAGLALILAMLPGGEAKSYAPMLVGRADTDFAARWPKPNETFRRIQPAYARFADRITTGALPRRAAAQDSDGFLFGGLVSGALSWDALASARTNARFEKATPRPQTAHMKLPVEAALELPTQPSPQPMHEAKTELAKFATAPFPYHGDIPGTSSPFLNVVEGGKKGHRTWSGRVLWESETFSDDRVLMHIPAGFNVDQPAVMVVFFHGHGADLTRDVLRRQDVPEQVSLSGVNAVLVAPQFAVDAADSSPGRFWEPGAFSRFVSEAGRKLAQLYGDPQKTRQFATMPVVLVAYSGGYLPAAWCIKNGGLGDRLHGVVLLDALYGEVNVFANWIKRNPKGFFVSATLGGATRRHNQELAQILEENKVPFGTELDRHLWRGRVALISADKDLNHRDYVNRAWVANPISDMLAKLN